MPPRIVHVTVRHVHVLVPALAILALAAGTAAAGNLRVSRQSPPSLTSPFTVQPEGNTSSRGWYCGGGGSVTKAPPVTFDVVEPVTMRVRFEDGKGGVFHGGGVLVIGGKYVCAGKHNEITLDFKPGHYELYPYTFEGSGAGVVHLEVPDRARAAIAQAAKALPTVRLGAPGALNPRTASAAPTASIDVADAGPTCLDDGERGTPIASVEVARAGRWRIASSTRLFILVGTTCHALRGESSLDAGRYVLWAVLPPGAPPTTFALEIDGVDDPVKVADAPHHALGALAQPVVVTGTVQPDAPPFSRNVCREMSRAPDFYITTDRPLQDVSLAPLWSPDEQGLDVLGPFEKDVEVSCDHDLQRHTYYREVLEGTYAVWVSGKPGARYQIQITRKGATVDPDAMVGALPATMTIAERAIAHYYPNLDRNLGDHMALFLAAPDPLFVYARTDVAGTAVIAGEPLLVDFAGDTSINVWRYDGSMDTVPAALVTGDRPATVALPTTVSAPAVDSIHAAENLAGPEDKPILDAYYKVKTTVEDCIEQYAAKHDPAYGHDTTNGTVEVYRIRGDEVINVTQQVFDQAQRRCGQSKIDAAEKKALAALAKTRDVRWKARLARARARFGL